VSRIDQAFQRAQGVVEPTTPEFPELEAAHRKTGSKMLDRYAAEHAHPHVAAPVVPGSSTECHHEAPKPTPAEAPKPTPIRRPEAFQEVRRPLHQGAMLSTAANLVTSPEIPQLAVEQHRRLAATLHELQHERDTRVLMVSSAVPREGKTLTVLNLALTLSESYNRRVLLVDADLRRPSIGSQLGIHSGPGLMGVLRSGDEPSIIAVSSHLSVLTAGSASPNPMAELASEQFKAFVVEMKARFDWVLIDTPPIGLLSDAQLIAGSCDGVIFVIAAGSTSYQLVKRSIAEVGPERIIGVVLNRVDEGELISHGYYGDYHYRPAS
jgi:capsular exopolysaccharide synthesis family protein